MFSWLVSPYKDNNSLPEINLQDNEFIFHAGTKIYNSKIYSNGGRVLNFVIKSDSFFPPYFLYGIFLLYAVVFYLSKTSDK